MQSAVFYSSLNTGVGVRILAQDSLYAMLNTGTSPTTGNGSIASYSYFNLGLPVPEKRDIVRGPRGWGILPVEKQEFTVFTEESKAKIYAYVNTISS